MEPASAAVAIATTTEIVNTVLNIKKLYDEVVAYKQHVGAVGEFLECVSAFPWPEQSLTRTFAPYQSLIKW